MKRARRRTIEEQPIPGARVLVAEARFYPKITDALLAGAMARLRAAEVEVERIMVPGSLEIPIAVAIALDRAEKAARPFDGVVALGCVIRGQTSHYEVIVRESARALMALAVARRIPLGNGILTVENERQALVRASPDKDDKGGGAAAAALALIRIARGQG